MKKIVITVDGWSSCGKSTMARQLAKKLNYIFVDSGAMYRAITLFFIRNQVDCTDKQAISSALAQVHLSFQLNEGSGNNEIWLNNENVASLIREMPVAEKVSEVAALGEVREFAVAQQQLIGAEKGIVMDGRDIGTAVFPDAELKIFMTADPKVRAERRYKEMIAKGDLISLEEVFENLAHRDFLDTTRTESPLKRAEDAIILDNYIIFRCLFKDNILFNFRGTASLIPYNPSF